MPPESEAHPASAALRCLGAAPLRAVLLLLFALAPAWAQVGPDEPISGVFARFDGEKLVVLADGSEHEISPPAISDVRETLKLVTEGQKVRLERRDGKVEDIAVTEPSFEVDATFDERIPLSDGRIYLKFKEGAQFQVADDKREQVTNQLFFVERGNVVRLALFGRQILSIRVKTGDMPAPRLVISPELQAAFQRLEKGDILHINGELRYQLARFDAQSLTIIPVTADDKPRGSEQWLPKGLIASLENLSAASREDPTTGPASPESQDDPITALSLEVGDTIGVGLKKGVVELVDGEVLALKVWERGAFGESIRYDRAQVADKVRRTELSSDRRIPIAGGEVRVVGFRSRDAHRAEYAFKVRINHDLEGSMLVGARLQGYREGRPAAGAVGPSFEVAPIFAGELYSWEGRLEESAPGVEVVLRLRDDNILPVDSEAAIRPIGLRLLNLQAGDELLRAYEAVVLNRRRKLIEIVLAHATLPKVDAAARARASETLKQCGVAALDVILDELSAEDGKLTVTLPDQRGEPITKPLEGRPDLYQAQLLSLLPRFSASFDSERLLRLFELFERYQVGNLGQLYLQALKSQAANTVAAIVELASTRGASTDPEVKAGVERAVTLLQSLERDALDPLCAQLEALGAPAEANQLRNLYGQVKTGQLIDRALNEVISIKRKQVREAQLSRLTEIRERMSAAEGLTGVEAYETWRALAAEIGELPQSSPRVQRALPDLGLHYGRACLATGRRGLAYDLFEAGLEASQKVGAEARKVGALLRPELGKLLLEALREELDATPLRAGAGHGYTCLRTLERGESLILAEDPNPDDAWVAVRDAGKVAFVPRSLVDTSQGEKARVVGASRPLIELQEMLAKARGYAPGAPADEVEAELLAREAMQLYRSNDYKEALERFTALRKLNPTHPALAHRMRAWFMVYWIYPVLVGSFLMGTLIYLVRNLFTRRTAVVESKAAGDYVYYGKDRARREREL